MVKINIEKEKDSEREIDREREREREKEKGKRERKENGQRKEIGAYINSIINFNNLSFFSLSVLYNIN